MLRTALLILLPAAALTLMTAGLTVWMRDADPRGLAMLIPGVTCLAIATVASRRAEE